MRKIIHVDMDAFFASIEQRDNPAYRGKPLAVGYAGERGVVAAASYEARKYGVRSAMSSRMALKRCPHIIFTPSRFDVYKEVSRQIMDIFSEYTDLIEPLSLDEAFLDVTVNHKNIRSATIIAREIKERIKKVTHLTASAGVSYNKFLAKIASDYNKPDGLFVIQPKDAEIFVESLAIEQFFGVGKVTAKYMHQIGIKNGLDLKQRTENELVTHFGKMGHQFYSYARAIDNRPVEVDRVRKSLGAENTFEKDIDSYDELLAEMKEIAKEVIRRISKRSFQGRTVTLKVKYADFRIISRSKTFSEPIDNYEKLIDISIELLQMIDISPKVRLLGLSIKNNDDNIWRDAVQLQIDFKFDDDKSID